MRRPIRTRRLGVAAIVSLLAFVALAGAGVRSFETCDNLSLGVHQVIILNRGCLVYVYEFENSGRHSLLIIYHPSLLVEDKSPASLDKTIPAEWRFAGFWGGELGGDYVPTYNMVYFGVPLWFPLLLLLIAPVRRLIARPADAPAFPVVADAKSVN